MLRASACIAFVLASGCTLLIPGTMPHDLHADAVKREHDRCDPTPVDPRIYSPEVIQRVQPYYRHVLGGPSGRESILAGAEIEMRPLPGVTEQLLTRGLECRGAQLLLGRVEPLPNEPYLLPEGWVTVDVRSGGGTFLVDLSAEDPRRARELLTRAEAFVGQ